MAQRDAQEAAISACQRAVAVTGLLGCLAHEISRQHRRNQSRDQQRDEHRHRHRKTELFEILASDATHEADRRENGDDRERDGDNRQANFVGALDGGAVGALAHAHMPRDVLNLNDGIIHQNARRQGQGQQADEVQREPHSLHGPVGRDYRQRQGDGRDHGCPPIAQEQKHHQHRQARALEQGLHRGLVVAKCVAHGVIDP